MELFGSLNLKGVVNMGKSNMSAKVSKKKRSKKEKERLIELENILQGNKGNIIAPNNLTAKEKEVFNFIVEEMSSSDVLQNISALSLGNTVNNYVCSIEYEKRRKSAKRNKDFDLEIKFKNMSLKCNEAYEKGMKSLSLTPEAIAKLAQLKAQMEQEQEEEENNPLLKLLGNRGV